MGIRQSLVAIVLFPLVAEAQLFRLPRKKTPLAPAHPTAQAALGRQQLMYRRSRWTEEGYGLVTNLQLPADAGPQHFTAAGTGTHASLGRGAFCLTLDFASSFLGSPARMNSTEFGVRARPFTLLERVRPYVDVRGAYTEISNSFSESAFTTRAIGAFPAWLSGSSRGFGGAAGAGTEVAVTSRFAITGGISSLRTHQTVYRYNTTSRFPTGSTVWGTSTRFVLGFSYNRGTNVALKQPR